MIDEARPLRPHLRAVGPEASPRPPPPPDISLIGLAAKLGGEPGNDYPECVHPTLGAVARGVYEHASEEARPALMPMAPLLVGTACTRLDVSARLVATCVSAALASPLQERIDADRARRLEAARRTACHLMARDRRGSTEGDGTDAPRRATRVWLHLLDPFRLTEPVYRRLVSPEPVSEAVVVIARASGDARDERLSQLLRWCTDLTRRLMPGEGLTDK